MLTIDSSLCKPLLCLLNNRRFCVMIVVCVGVVTEALGVIKVNSISTSGHWCAYNFIDSATLIVGVGVGG